jgi:hypothetical protein
MNLSTYEKQTNSQIIGMSSGILIFFQIQNFSFIFDPILIPTTKWLRIIFSTQKSNKIILNEFLSSQKNCLYNSYKSYIK